MSQRCQIFGFYSYLLFFILQNIESNFMNNKWSNFWKTLGPGILFASTCIGVSHLVQSTRAGADYGFALVWAIILANIFKYPFFEFTSRYTNATGDSVIDGYYKMSKWILIIFAVITLSTMFIVTSAVTFVTAGLLSNLLPSAGLNTDTWVLVILSFCAIILIMGKFSLLDSLLKIVGTVLLISTIVAFFSAWIEGPTAVSPDFIPKDPYSSTGIIFLIALMGWMPTAVDMSTWTSLWTEARIRQTGYFPKLKETLLDFNFGYIVSAVLALFFLSLGGLVIYGSGTELSDSSPVFAHQLISMYTSNIGEWSYFIIAVAAFSTMFSTSITVMDGYGRAMGRVTQLLLNGKKNEYSRKEFIFWALLLIVGAWLVATQFVNSLKSLIDLATIVSFIIAPFAGLLNYLVVHSKEIPSTHRPPRWLKWLAFGGLAFLSVFTILYILQLV